MKKVSIPKEVKNILYALQNAGFKAYVVGGCVRDLLMDKNPTDWDVTTNAKPEEIQKIFGEENSFYENDFGTVGVKTDSEDKTLAVIEVTTYRLESAYSNKRHPDEVKFTVKLEDDLKRRDFTMNAIALTQLPTTSYQPPAIIDIYSGETDIKNKVIRAVGDPNERFSEDTLRIIRAIRFAATLGFSIEEKTYASISRYANNLADISRERIRDEFTKLICGDHAVKAIEILVDSGLMKNIIPELLEGIGIGQNLHHIYTVWEHNLRSFAYAVENNYSFDVRLASLMHDIGKPRTKRGEGKNSTFYGHDVVGSRIVRDILSRLKFSKEQIEKISKLVRWHMFYYDVDAVTESSVRRLVANIGKENVEDLIKVREADRIGSGVPKAKPYKLRHLQFMIDKVARDPISPKMLKINGDDIMRLLGIEPGPKVGMIINALMEEVLDDPTKNSKDYLDNRTSELNKLTEKELLELAKKGKLKTAEEESREILEIKEKHRV